MGDSIKKYKELVEEGRISEMKVKDYQCLCKDTSKCTLCSAEKKTYLVTQWLKNDKLEDPVQCLYRLENKTADYAQGFVDALSFTPLSFSVTLDEVV
tara:strand:+ start:8264 stop:8554 length:291 start_codon:yes stop_codon:yes gene_type:complete